MLNVIPFDFENHNIRVVNKDGAPWFVLADVCRVLELSNTSKAASRLDADEKTTLTLSEGPENKGFGPQQRIIINEPGMWRLVLRSDKPEARRFQKWVVTEVLPAIRKNGSYVGEMQIPQTLAEALRRATDLAEERDAARAQVVEMAPTVEAFDRFASVRDSMCMLDAAKTLKIPPREVR